MITRHFPISSRASVDQATFDDGKERLASISYLPAHNPKLSRSELDMDNAEASIHPLLVATENALIAQAHRVAGNILTLSDGKKAFYEKGKLVHGIFDLQIPTTDNENLKADVRLVRNTSRLKVFRRDMPLDRFAVHITSSLTGVDGDTEISESYIDYSGYAGSSLIGNVPYDFNVKPILDGGPYDRMYYENRRELIDDHASVAQNRIAGGLIVGKFVEIAGDYLGSNMEKFDDTELTDLFIAWNQYSPRFSKITDLKSDIIGLHK